MGGASSDAHHQFDPTVLWETLSASSHNGRAANEHTRQPKPDG